MEQRVRRRAAACGIGALTLLCLALPGCHWPANRVQPQPATPPIPVGVLVVAPVLNLSGSNDFDTLKFTDVVASEFAASHRANVVPVNLTLAALARHGKPYVQTGQEAAALAHELGADAAIVTAVTEYRPYDPPIIGLIMQWYDAAPAAASSAAPANPSASPQQHPGGSPVSPRWQIQRVFDASREEITDEVRAYADHHEEHDSPYEWRKVLKSQELYVRYCSWSLIRSMVALTSSASISQPNEVSR